MELFLCEVIRTMRTGLQSVQLLQLVGKCQTLSSPLHPDRMKKSYFVFALAQELVAVQRKQAVKDNFCGHFETVWKANVHRWELRPTKLVRMMVVPQKPSDSCAVLRRDGRDQGTTLQGHERPVL